VDREHPLEPPADLLRLLHDEPLARLVFPDDQVGWLVTRYADARTVLADTRFSSRGDLIAAGTDLDETEEPEEPEQVPGFFISMDPPRHTRCRKALTGMFTARRIRTLTRRIEEVVDEHLDAIAAAGPPADLIESFALPIPLFVICELLGVPYDDRDEFHQRTAAMTDLSLPEEDGARAHAELVTYLESLVRARRERRGADILSDLVGAEPPGGPLTDAEIAGIGSMLLNAGYETTMGSLGLALAALLSDTDQLAALRAGLDEPGVAERAVEELLRYLTILHLGIPRVATEELEIAGTRIRPGERLLVSVAAANRDPERFADPGRLDVTAANRTHIAFGHGPHQCLGQELARIELRVALVRLLRRFPGLALAVRLDELPMRTETLLYGVDSLPVVW
jgi:cytochrome P450